MKSEHGTVTDWQLSQPLAAGFRNPCRSRFHSHPLQSQPLLGKARTCLEGPFGELLRATGPMAKANPFRFSTKYQDEESDLICYGERYYGTSSGRWLSHDSIEENGGPNLYGFVLNWPTVAIDTDGRQIFFAPIPPILIESPPMMPRPMLPPEVINPRPSIPIPTPTPRFPIPTPTPRFPVPAPKAPPSGTTLPPLNPPVPIVPPQLNPNPNPGPTPTSSPSPVPNPNPTWPRPVNAPPSTASCCKECQPYAKGTIGYQGPDTGHTHYPSGDPHLHLFKVNQDPTSCRCFWNKNDPDSANPPPDPKWVHLGQRGDPFPIFTY
jgi:RHS repeat-associated protein